MARARTRFKRFLYLVVALLVLLLLLQLNEWIPGVWKGGGSGGFRAGGDLGILDPSQKGSEDEATDDPGDPGVVEAPTEPPRNWPPKRGVLVQLRAPNGELAEGWRLGVGSGGPTGSGPDDGTLRLKDKAVFQQGFRIRHGSAELRHAHGLDVPATKYVVHLPSGDVPGVRRPDAVTVEVRDPETGAPVEGARVVSSQGSATTDAEGRAQLKGASSEPFQVDIQKEGHVVRRGVWLRPRDRAATRVDLPVEIEKTITFRWADRRPAAVQRVTITDADQQELGRFGDRGGVPQSKQTIRVPADKIASAHLAIRAVRTGVDGYRVSIPLKDVGAEVILPEPRTVRIVVRDVQGQPVPDAHVAVHHEFGEARATAPLGSWRTVTNLHGEATLSLAPGQDCRITVGRGSLGPAARRLRSVDGSDTIEFVLEEGIMIPVRLAPEGGAGLLRVVETRGTSSGVRVRTHKLIPHTTGHEPMLIGPVPAGPTELFATAHGHAWSAKVLEARAAMGTVDVPIRRGHPIQLVVEDTFGVAIEGARVEVSSHGEGEPYVTPSASVAGITDAEGRSGLPPSGGIGVLLYPDGRYDVRISAPGYSTQVLKNIRPGGALHFVTLVPSK